MNLLGLFDRPADGPAVDALLAQHIPGLTDDLFFERIETTRLAVQVAQDRAGAAFRSKRAARLREAKSRLRKLRLLSKPNPKDPHELDAHPVVRAFFACRSRGRARGRQGRAWHPLPPLCGCGAGPARYAGRNAAAVPRRPARREGGAGAGGVGRGVPAAN